MRTDFATLARWSEIMECRRLRVRCATAPPRLRKAMGKLSNERAVEHERCIRLGCPVARDNLTYSDHRHSLGEASGRSQRTIIHVRVQGIRERADREDR